MWHCERAGFAFKWFEEKTVQFEKLRPSPYVYELVEIENTILVHTEIGYLASLNFIKLVKSMEIVVKFKNIRSKFKTKPCAGLFECPFQSNFLVITINQNHDKQSTWVQKKKRHQHTKSDFFPLILNTFLFHEISSKSQALMSAEHKFIAHWCPQSISLHQRNGGQAESTCFLPISEFNELKQSLTGTRLNRHNWFLCLECYVKNMFWQRNLLLLLLNKWFSWPNSPHWMRVEQMRPHGLRYIIETNAS